jgi:uncharacterized protein YjbI with pentapeptide repeats
MAQNDHLRRLFSVGTWNSWREENQDILPDFTGVFFQQNGPETYKILDTIGKFQHVRLRAARFSDEIFAFSDFTGAGLRRADFTDSQVPLGCFRDANLSMADLTNINLCGADFTNATLNSASAVGARLDSAKLIGTGLWGTNLSGANLDQTDFTNCIMSQTVLGDVDLSTAIGLETVRHSGPSVIDLGTILKSHGDIPNAFLRNAGLPNEVIGYMRSLARPGIDFYSLFISYSTTDQRFAEKIRGDLQRSGVRCWFAPHDMRGGKKLHEQIDRAIRVYDKLLLILSPASMASEWVKTEVAYAREREALEHRRVLFPISLCPFKTIQEWKNFDSDRGSDSAREVRQYYIPDFSGWERGDCYRPALSGFCGTCGTK